MKRWIGILSIAALMTVLLTACDYNTGMSRVVDMQDVKVGDATIHRIVLDRSGKRFVLSASDELNAKIIIGESANFYYDKKNNITQIVGY